MNKPDDVYYVSRIYLDKETNANLTEDVFETTVKEVAYQKCDQLMNLSENNETFVVNKSF